MPQNPTSIPSSSSFASASVAASAPRQLDDHVPSIVRCEELWFSDGNVVLALVPSSNASGNTHVYRVHKSVLGSLSDVWRGLFALAQPPSERETYADTEVVRFYDDNPDDMREFLQVVYCQRSAFAFPVSRPCLM